METRSPGSAPGTMMVWLDVVVTPCPRRSQSAMVTTTGEDGSGMFMVTRAEQSAQCGSLEAVRQLEAQLIYFNDSTTRWVLGPNNTGHFPEIIGLI